MSAHIGQRKDSVAVDLPGSFYFVLFSAVLGLSAIMPFRLPMNITIVEVFLLFTACGLVIGRSKFSGMDSKVLVLFFLFVMSTSLSVPFALDKIEALKVSLRWCEIFILFAAFSGLFANATPRQGENLVTVIAVAVAVHSLINDGVGIIETSRIRVGAFALIPFALILSRVKSGQMSAVWILIGIAVLFFTRSRTVMVGMILMLLVYSAGLGFRRSLKFYLLGACIGPLFFLDGSIVERFSQLDITEESAAYSTWQRLFRVAAALYAFSDNVFLGVGGNNLFSYVMSNDSSFLQDWKVWLVSNEKTSAVPHNVILQIFAEHGVISGALFSLLLMRILMLSFRRGAGLYIKLAIIVFLLFLMTGYISELKRVFVAVMIWYAGSPNMTSNFKKISPTFHHAFSRRRYA